MQLVWIKLLWIALGIILALLLLDQLLRWMERREWIYYRRLRPKESTRAAMSVFQEIVQPEVRHVWEEQKQRAAENAGQKEDSDR